MTQLGLRWDMDVSIRGYSPTPHAPERFLKWGTGVFLVRRTQLYQFFQKKIMRVRVKSGFWENCSNKFSNPTPDKVNLVRNVFENLPHFSQGFSIKNHNQVVLKLIIAKGDSHTSPYQPGVMLSILKSHCGLVITIFFLEKLWQPSKHRDGNEKGKFPKS